MFISNQEKCDISEDLVRLDRRLDEVKTSNRLTLEVVNENREDIVNQLNALTTAYDKLKRDFDLLIAALGGKFNDVTPTVSRTFSLPK